MPRVLIIDAHPDAGRFTSALADACAAGAAEGGADVQRLNLRELRFDLVLRRGFAEPQAWEPDLEAAWAAVTAADHLVWVLPIWWGGLPALLKGFIDRLFLPGRAFEHRGGALPEGLLAGRSARVVATMDSPWWWYWWKHARAGHRQLTQATLHYVGVMRVSETTVYALRKLDAAGRDAALARARAAVRGDAADVAQRRARLGG